MRTLLVCAAVLAFATSATAEDVIADSVSENLSPPLHNGGSACPADVTVLSDGDFSRPGYCPRVPTPAGYTITFTFSPDADERTTGLRIWSNAGSNYADAELRVFDLEVDYLDATGAPQTLTLADVDIGDTVSVSDSKFVPFTGTDPDGLRQVTEFRMSNLRGRSGDPRVEFREVNAFEVSPPTVVLSSAAGAPGDPVTITATFSEDVTGVDLTDFIVTNATASGLVQISPSVYQFTATPSAAATDVTVSLPRAVVLDTEESTPNLASGTLSITITGSLPPSDEALFLETVRSEELKTLRQGIARAQRLSRGARDRLAADRRCRSLEDEETASPEELDFCDRYWATLNQPLKAQASTLVSDDNAVFTGIFKSQKTSADGQHRRLVFGAFDITHDSDLGVIATLSAQVAWERLQGEHALWGYFIGAEASQSDVQGTYTGDRQRLGISGGLYGARDLRNGIVADGFAVLGYGLNSLDITDGAVDVDADYTAPSILLGGALSGERAYQHFTLHPELALAAGYTNLSNIDYDAGGGPAEADGGHVALARLSLTPEIRMPWEAAGNLYDSGSFDVAPSLICEWVDTGSSSGDCGAGLGLELSAQSRNGAHELSGSLAVEAIGDTTRTSLTLMLESSF